MAESRRLSGNHSVSVLTAYVMVGLGSLIMLAPFYFMFVFATHSKTEIFTLPPPLWPGTSFFENLKVLFLFNNFINLVILGDPNYKAKPIK